MRTPLMETHARHTLIGLFTLAVIAAGFVFVYWLNATGGLGQRAYYRIAFEGPVSGLLRGSAVLFNGIRVGEVTSLRLDAVDPRKTTAAIAIDRSAPVRSDTRITIEFQGLTGAPVVSLIGGAAASPPPAWSSGEPPLLIAEKDAGVGMGQTARDVLRHIDGVVTVNAEPLRSLISNIDKFSDALARNSDRVDGIVAGLERLTGAGAEKVKPRIYEIAPARDFPDTCRRLGEQTKGQLVVLEPTALSLFETEKLLVLSRDGEAPVIERAQWPDLLQKVVQARIIQSFENAGYSRVLGRSAEAVKPDHQLLLEVRAFQISQVSAPLAEVELAARVVDAEGRIVASRVFRHSAPVSSLDAALVAAALSDTFVQVAGEIVIWTCAAL
jgi:phospholipid/cholesterol/gamma-HCH transport system substrate-binding protein